MWEEACITWATHKTPSSPLFHTSSRKITQTTSFRVTCLLMKQDFAMLIYKLTNTTYVIIFKNNYWKNILFLFILKLEFFDLRENV